MELAVPLETHVAPNSENQHDGDIPWESIHIVGLLEKWLQWPLLLIWFNFNHSMDK